MYVFLLAYTVWIYHLLFVCFLFVCMITDFSAENKSSGINLCRAVHWHRRYPRHRISHFCELCSSEAQNRTNQPVLPCNVMLLRFCYSHAYQVRAACGRRIGMLMYTSMPEDGHTCSCVACFCCVGFSFREWLIRTSPKWPILCRDVPDRKILLSGRNRIVQKLLD